MKKIVLAALIASLCGCASMTEQEKKNIAIALGAVAVGVAAYHASKGGSFGYAPPADWDAFYIQHQLVWRCRSTSTGVFVEDRECYGMAQTDARWPSKLPW